MLVITRREAEEIVIGDPKDPIGVVRIASIKGDRVRVALEFPAMFPCTGAKWPKTSSTVAIARNRVIPTLPDGLAEPKSHDASKPQKKRPSNIPSPRVLIDVPSVDIEFLIDPWICGGRPWPFTASLRWCLEINRLSALLHLVDLVAEAFGKVKFVDRRLEVEFDVLASRSR